MPAAFPPRLHILLARDAPVGVIIRRGPAKSVCTILWDRANDTFQLGQWLRGRIYERRADISPDGKYTIYFALSGKWSSEAKGSWTAISRVPYLKAVALFPTGHCWNGGGLFTGPRSYWLNSWGHSLGIQTTEVVQDQKFVPQGGRGGECLSVYYPRLLRDGWEPKEPRSTVLFDQIDVFEKPAPQGWILRKIAHASADHPEGTSVYWDEHELAHPATGRSLQFPKWEWADLDGKRLVWSTKGTLNAARFTEGGLTGESVLADFGPMKFEAIAAPY